MADDAPVTVKSENVAPPPPAPVAVKTEVAAPVKTENGASDATATAASAAAAASGLPQLNGAVFFRRLQTLYKSWGEHKSDATWADADVFCVLAGKPQPDESGYRKSAVLQIFLLGFLEFPETLMIFTPKTLYVVTAGKKCT